MPPCELAGLDYAQWALVLGQLSIDRMTFHLLSQAFLLPLMSVSHHRQCKCSIKCNSPIMAFLSSCRMGSCSPVLVLHKLSFAKMSFDQMSLPSFCHCNCTCGIVACTLSIVIGPIVIWLIDIWLIVIWLIDIWLIDIWLIDIWLIIVKRVSWFRSSLLLRINNKHTYKY